MVKEPLKVIGINPGTRYLGIAVLHGAELLDWRIKVLDGRWSNSKIEKVKEIISDQVERYETRYVAIKKVHASRSSKNLDKIVMRIKEIARKKNLKLCHFSIKDLENIFVTEVKLNRKNLAEALASQYPELRDELQKERLNKNPYFLRAHEAVALAAACYKKSMIFEESKTRLS